MNKPKETECTAILSRVTSNADCGSHYKLVVTEQNVSGRACVVAELRMDAQAFADMITSTYSGKLAIGYVRPRIPVAALTNQQQADIGSAVIVCEHSMSADSDLAVGEEMLRLLDARGLQVVPK